MPSQPLAITSGLIITTEVIRCKRIGQFRTIIEIADSEVEAEGQNQKKILIVAIGRE